MQHRFPDIASAYDCRFESFIIPAQNQFAFAPGDGCVKQIAAQHPPVLFHHRQNDHRKFAALRFMDGTTVSQNKLIPIVSIVSDFHGIEQDRDLVDLLFRFLGELDGSDFTHIPIKDIIFRLVHQLKHLVAYPIDDIKKSDFPSFLVPFWIEDLLHHRIDGINAGSSFVHRRQNLDILCSEPF